MHVFNNTRALLTLEEKNFYQVSRIMKSMPFYVNTRPSWQDSLSTFERHLETRFRTLQNLYKQIKTGNHCVKRKTLCSNHIHKMWMPEVWILTCVIYARLYKKNSKIYIGPVTASNDKNRIRIRSKDFWSESFARNVVFFFVSRFMQVVTELISFVRFRALSCTTYAWNVINIRKTAILVDYCECRWTHLYDHFPNLYSKDRPILEGNPSLG